MFSQTLPEKVTARQKAWAWTCFVGATLASGIVIVMAAAALHG